MHFSKAVLLSLAATAYAAPYPKSNDVGLTDEIGLTQLTKDVKLTPRQLEEATKPVTDELQRFADDYPLQERQATEVLEPVRAELKDLSSQYSVDDNAKRQVGGAGIGALSTQVAAAEKVVSDLPINKRQQTLDGVPIGSVVNQVNSLKDLPLPKRDLASIEQQLGVIPKTANNGHGLIAPKKRQLEGLLEKIGLIQMPKNGTVAANSTMPANSTMAANSTMKAPTRRQNGSNLSVVDPNKLVAVLQDVGKAAGAKRQAPAADAPATNSTAPAHSSLKPQKDGPDAMAEHIVDQSIGQLVGVAKPPLGVVGGGH